MKLHVDVQTLDDFLYLLDGGLLRLQRLTIYVAWIDHSDVIVVSIGKSFLIHFTSLKVQVHDSHLLRVYQK